MLEAELNVLEGHLRGTNFPLGVRSVIGRGVGCDIQLVHDGISRRHCQVTVREDGATVEDLGSTNGTKLNGSRVTQAPLYHGDKIEVGPVTLQFNCLGARNPQDTGAELAPHLAPGVEPVSLSSSRLIPLPPPGELAREPSGKPEVGLEVLYDLANFLVARHDAAALAVGLGERVGRAFGPDRVVLFDYDAVADKIRAAHVHRGAQDAPGSTVPVPETVVTKCIREGKTVVAGIEEEGKQRSVLCAPLRVDQRTLGAIYLDRPLPGKAYDAQDASALASAAGLAAFALDRLYFEREARARAHDLERQVAGIEAERDQLSAAFQHAEEGLVVLDDEGGVVTANPPATALLEAGQRAGAPLLATILAPVLAGKSPMVRARWVPGESPIDVVAWVTKNDAGEPSGAIARLERGKRPS